MAIPPLKLAGSLLVGGMAAIAAVAVTGPPAARVSPASDSSNVTAPAAAGTRFAACPTGTVLRGSVCLKVVTIVDPTIAPARQDPAPAVARREFSQPAAPAQTEPSQQAEPQDSGEHEQEHEQEQESGD